MKLRINEVSEIYERLKQPERTSPQDSLALEMAKDFREGNSWKQGKKNAPVRDSNALYGSDATLPDPMDHATVCFYRKGDSYHSTLWVYGDRSFYSRIDVFKGISEDFKENFKDKWMPMSPDGTGYVLGGNGEAVVSIGKVVTDGREISIGSNGAIERKFSDLQSFSDNVSRLENTAEVLVNACVKRLAASGKMYAVPPENFTINLSCI